MWLNRHPMNNSLVVFIHGIFGDLWGTWKGMPAIIQDEVQQDVLLGSYDYYSFGYQTKAFRQAPLVPYALDPLTDFLQSVNNSYDTVVLICHSQGGLLGKLYIIQELEAGRGLSLKVDCIITLGTPHRGRRILRPLHWFQHTRPFKYVLPFGQLSELASSSGNIATLKKCWTTAYISKELIKPEAKRKHIRSVAVKGAYDIWAGRAGAEGFPDVDSVRALTLTHPALAKPRSGMEAVVQVLKTELKAHKAPVEIIQQLRKIRASQSAQDEFTRQWADEVFAMVGIARPALSELGRQIKTATLLTDFLVDFQKRPLRVATIGEAVKLYVQRTLGEPA